MCAISSAAEGTAVGLGRGVVVGRGVAVGGAVWAVADRDEARTYFEVDFWSPLSLIGAFVPGMRHRRQGAVVNVTSVRVVMAWPAFGHSTAACAALSQITETLRLELGRFGVSVVEVIPGPIETPAQGPTKLVPGIVEGIHSRLGVGQPEDLAALIVDAVEGGEERVFWSASARDVYENPVATRTNVRDDVKRLLPEGSGLPDDLLDTFVVGAEDPMILDARKVWELEHSGT